MLSLRWDKSEWEHLHYQWFASVTLSSYIIEQNSQWRENSNVGPEKRYTPITFPSQNHHNFRLKLSSHFDHIIITLRWKCEIFITYFFKDEIFSSQNYNFLTVMGWPHPSPYNFPSIKMSRTPYNTNSKSWYFHHIFITIGWKCNFSPYCDINVIQKHEK